MPSSPGKCGGRTSCLSWYTQGVPGSETSSSGRSPRPSLGGPTRGHPPPRSPTPPVTPPPRSPGTLPGHSPAPVPTHPAPSRSSAPVPSAPSQGRSSLPGTLLPPRVAPTSGSQADSKGSPHPPPPPPSAPDDRDPEDVGSCPRVSEIPSRDHPLLRAGQHRLGGTKGSSGGQGILTGFVTFRFEFSLGPLDSEHWSDQSVDESIDPEVRGVSGTRGRNPWRRTTVHGLSPT